MLLEVPIVVAMPPMRIAQLTVWSAIIQSPTGGNQRVFVMEPTED